MAGHSKWANIKHRKGAQGEAEMSRMHLTCIRAAERPATDGRAGDALEAQIAAPWTACTDCAFAVCNSQ